MEMKYSFGFVSVFKGVPRSGSFLCFLVPWMSLMSLGRIVVAKLQDIMGCTLQWWIRLSEGKCYDTRTDPIISPVSRRATSGEVGYATLRTPGAGRWYPRRRCARAGNRCPGIGGTVGIPCSGIRIPAFRYWRPP